VAYRSLKVIKTSAIQKLGCGFLSYSPSIVTMDLSVAVCEIFSVKEWCDLENTVKVVYGHWKWYHLIVRIRVPIRLS